MCQNSLSEKKLRLIKTFLKKINVFCWRKNSKDKWFATYNDHRGSIENAQKQYFEVTS